MRVNPALNGPQDRSDRSGSSQQTNNNNNNGGEAPGWGVVWDRPGGEGDGAMLEKLMEQAAAIIDKHEEENGFAEASASETYEALWDGLGGNSHFLGFDDDAWLAEARRTGIFVGFPTGWNGHGLRNDAAGFKPTTYEAEQFAKELTKALTQLNQMFARIAKYATDDQLKAMRVAVATPSNLEPNQVEGSDEVPEDQRGGWLATILRMIEDDHIRDNKLYNDVINQIRDDDVGSVMGQVLQGARDALYKMADQVSIDLGKERDDWRIEASQDLAEETATMLFLARQTLSADEVDDFEKYLEELHEELLSGEYRNDEDAADSSEPAPSSGGRVDGPMSHGIGTYVNAGLRAG